jgi:glycosyltransferase involved in cell wall biosynthesis
MATHQTTWRQDTFLGQVERETPAPHRDSTNVMLLTNCIPPYWLPTFQSLAKRLSGLQILLSTAMESDRDWTPELAGLPVRIQKCWTYTGRTKYADGFSQEIWRHVPYDTIPLLFRSRPKVVISAQLGYRTLQAAIYRILFPNTRLIVWAPLSAHTEKGLPIWRVLQRKVLLRAVDAVLVNGRGGLKYMMGLGVPREKIFFLPYCAKIAPQLKVPLKRAPSAAKRLVFVGRLIFLKGLETFLKALTDWSHRHPEEECEFWIAGDGPIRGELERIPMSPQLRVRYLGNVAYEKLPQLYAQGGILVFPTLADEWGVVVNEGLAAGLPALGSLYSQAVEELIEDGVNGWTFRPDRPEEVASAIERALGTPEDELEKMRRASRGRIAGITPEFGAECFLKAIRYVSNGTVVG